MVRHRLEADLEALRGRRLLVALSGGADSTALLCLLCERREELGLALFAAHLDHAIRPESAEDARWCRALCARLEVPFHTRRLDVPAEAARAGEGLETAARRLRYAYLMALREELRADYIALAHHMDDQAETVLMHLMRGAGVHGAGGMAGRSGALVRPLLGVRKAEIEAYLAARGQDWREDATNAVCDTPRNALRHNVVPALEAAWPGAVPAIARFAEAARLEDDYIAAQTQAYLERAAVAAPNGTWLDLSSMPHPAILRRAIRAVTGEAAGWERTDAAARLADARRGRLEISGEWRAERGRRGLWLLRGARKECLEPVPLAAAGETALPGVCRVDVRPCAAEPVRDDPMRQALRAEALKGAVLRTRRDGDRIRPLGCGDRLLSDYLTDRGVDRPLRDHIALLAREGRVLWVLGVGISEDARLTSSGDAALQLACRYEYDLPRLLPPR